MSTAYFSAVYLPLLLSALALLICVISFIVLKSYLRRRTSREWILQEGLLSEIREEVNALLKSIDETADRDITLIKDREQNLQALLINVEKRLKLYIREMDKRKEAEETYAAFSAAENQPASPAPEPSAPGTGGGTYLDLGKLRYQLKKQEARVPETIPSSVSEQIRSLLKEGASIPMVASRLGLSIAEVEFTAALLEMRKG